MNNKWIKYTCFIIILLIIIQNLHCNRTDNTNNKNIDSQSEQKIIACDTTNKINLLLRDVFKKKYIFPIVNQDTNYLNPNRYNYLISKGFITPGKTFYISVRHSKQNYGPDSIKVISIEKDSIKNNKISQVYLFAKHTNYDTSEINLVVGYRIENFTYTECTFDYFLIVKTVNG